MPAGSIAEFLARMALFVRLPAGEVGALAAVAREERVRAREYVFMEGDPSSWLCFVKSGHVRIIRHARTGRAVVLELLGTGEIFGGVAVLERRPYPACAQATEPSVVVKLPQGAMVAVAERHPTIVREIALMIVCAAPTTRWSRLPWIRPSLSSAVSSGAGGSRYDLDHAADGRGVRPAPGRTGTGGTQRTGDL